MRDGSCKFSTDDPFVEAIPFKNSVELAKLGPALKICEGEVKPGCADDNLLFLSGVGPGVTLMVGGPGKSTSLFILVSSGNFLLMNFPPNPVLDLPYYDYFSSFVASFNLTTR